MCERLHTSAGCPKKCTTAPPSPKSVMNSRRFIIRSPRRRARAASAGFRGRTPSYALSRPFGVVGCPLILVVMVRQSYSASPAPRWSRGLVDLPSMLRRKHVCIEGRNPHLALLGDAKVAQSMFDIRSHHLPEKIWIICSQIGSTTVFQFIAHSCLAKFVK